MQREGAAVGRRHVGTLMQLMGIEANYRKPRTSIPAPGHKIYPYLFTNIAIEQSNQVWATDIAYIPMAEGFAYLAAILDLYSRKVLSFRVSNALTTEFCVEALEEALTRDPAPNDATGRADELNGDQIPMSEKGDPDAALRERTQNRIVSRATVEILKS